MLKEIKEICIKSNISYFEKVILSLGEQKDKINQVKKLFDKHMEEISIVCINEFLNKEKLTESFIKNLHKIHFPPGYKETTNKDGIEVVCMIPGVYRSNENFGWVEAGEVKNQMKNFIKNYNENIEKAENKYNFIIKNLLDFLKIHPFGNGNGRIISILIDLMLLKNNLKPIYFKYIQENNKNLFQKIIIESINNKNISNLKLIIKKSNFIN